MVIVTGFYAALLALFYVGLSYHVIRHRKRLGVSLTEQGGGEALTRAVRAHGNFMEYVPFALVLMGCFELLNGSRWLLHLAGIVLILARAFHAWGILRAEPRGAGFRCRIAGMAATFAVFLLLAVLLLLKTLPVLFA